MPLFVIPATDAAQLAEGPAAVPWTDGCSSERYEREAFIRLCELAIEHARSSDAKPAALLSYNASYAVASEDVFRNILKHQASYANARIGREVAIVRLRAEHPEAATTCCTICGHATNWHEPAGCRGCVCVKTPPQPVPLVVDNHREICGEFEAECSCGRET